MYTKRNAKNFLMEGLIIMEYRIKGGNAGAKIFIDNERQSDGIVFFDVNLVLEEEAVPEEFCISFSIPAIDAYSVWSPSVRFDRHLGPNWSKRVTASRLASWMPLHAIVSSAGKNRTLVALSDAKTPTSLGTGICEEDACVQWDIKFFTIPVAPLKEYKATVRIDERDIAYYDAIYDAVAWWENDCGYVPAYVPESAKLPMNSLWYSYHQKLNVDEILEECRISKKLGLDTVIVDDGWQTDDSNRGYQFCGDWEVAKTKIPDMKEFVKQVHETGMKIMIWYSVPFMGTGAKMFEHFKDMLLNGRNNVYALDPRYKEVRDYLVGMYAHAMKEWNLDGLKLDFIDSFRLEGKSLEYDARRDYQSLEDAVDVLMTEVSDTLRKINPEALIEFRQTYVGPAIRKYGNMLRVMDCPNDAICNRQDVVNLRFTSGNTAVHSDMIMWNHDDTVESAALQFVSLLYSVPQVSVKLAEISEEHKKMLEFYLSFWHENRETLLEGKILAANPESGYSIVCAEKCGNAIFTSYTDRVIDCRKYKNIIAVNSSRSSSLILKGAEGKNYKCVDCMGNILDEGKVDGALFEVTVPVAGMVYIG